MALGEARPGPGQAVYLRRWKASNSLKHSRAVQSPTREVKSIFEQSSSPWQYQPTHLDGADFFFFATGGAADEPSAPPPSVESPCPDMDRLSASRRLDMLGERTRLWLLDAAKKEELRLVCSCTERIRAKDSTTPSLRAQGYNSRKHNSTGRSSRLASAERSKLASREE